MTFKVGETKLIRIGMAVKSIDNHDFWLGLFFSVLVKIQIAYSIVG